MSNNEKITDCGTLIEVPRKSTSGFVMYVENGVTKTRYFGNWKQVPWYGYVKLWFKNLVFEVRLKLIKCFGKG